MVISCSAYGCRNKWSRESPVHFHKFPFRCKKLCEKWISALKRKHFAPTRASLVCSDHFREEDYIIKPGHRKTRLKKNAVPSIFNFPVSENLLVNFDSFYLPSPPPHKNIVKQKRGRKPKLKRKRKRKSTENADNDDYTIIDCVIDELDVYENVDTKSNPKATDVSMCIEEDIEEIKELDTGVEEDQCNILGNIWGERLKELPFNVRPLVRQVIDDIFEEARIGILTEKLSVEDL